MFLLAIQPCSPNLVLCSCAANSGLSLRVWQEGGVPAYTGVPSTGVHCREKVSYQAKLGMRACSSLATNLQLFKGHTVIQETGIKGSQRSARS